jgi:hypothetical protein
VETPEEAQRLKFIGSPTIRIDGADPFANGDEPFALACRIYDTPAGRAGSPSAAQMLEVVNAAVRRHPASSGPVPGGGGVGGLRA